MEEKKEHKIQKFIKKYGAGIVVPLIIVLITAYFVNVIFVKNKEVAISVLILEYTADTTAVENQIGKIVGLKENQKIEIKSIDAKQSANNPIILTWIRAKTIDVIIGSEEEVKVFAQAGYLKKLNEEIREKDFMCGLAKYNDLGEIISGGKEECFGKYTTEIKGVEIKHPVVCLAANLINEDNAEKVLYHFTNEDK